MKRHRWHKALHGLVPVYLTDHLNVHSHSRVLRSTNQDLHQVPGPHDWITGVAVLFLFFGPNCEIIFLQMLHMMSDPLRMKTEKSPCLQFICAGGTAKVLVLSLTTIVIFLNKKKTIFKTAIKRDFFF